MMSKSMPEIGDVWVHKMSNTVKIYIANTFGYKNTLSYCCLNMVGFESEKSKTKLMREYEYLGKSKVNFNQLFEVEQSNDDK